VSFDDRAGRYLRALGVVVRAERKRLSLSQEELAERAGLDRTFVSAIERGHQNVSAKTVLRLGDALGSSPARLLTAAEAELGKDPPKSRR
jgi:transcriptional regulator with XRE-family HTH domain